jgi:recombination protein RecR
MASPEIDALTQALARLPGLGPRSARRAVLHLLKKRETALAPLLRALERSTSACRSARLRQCRHARSLHHLRRSAPRREALLCVVEEVSDLWALDRSRLFPGRFHVLGGRLSALEGVRPEDLGIDKLSAASPRRHRRGRARHERDAGGPDHRPLSRRAARALPVRLTQLAHGLPVGGELDYLDEGTLAQALRARRPVA